MTSVWLTVIALFLLSGQNHPLSYHTLVCVLAAIGKISAGSLMYLWLYMGTMQVGVSLIASMKVQILTYCKFVCKRMVNFDLVVHC